MLGVARGELHKPPAVLAGAFRPRVLHQGGFSRIRVAARHAWHVPRSEGSHRYRRERPQPDVHDGGIQRLEEGRRKVPALLHRAIGLPVLDLLEGVGVLGRGCMAESRGLPAHQGSCSEPEQHRPGPGGRRGRVHPALLRWQRAVRGGRRGLGREAHDDDDVNYQSHDGGSCGANHDSSLAAASCTGADASAWIIWFATCAAKHCLVALSDRRWHPRLRRLPFVPGLVQEETGALIVGRILGLRRLRDGRLQPADG
mmetsp:Transcript_18306/g.50207  ORF Transcript_18306/g.50207 Transcript_18306/m.50207 type:complete len:256 (-) Transcript_18306:174-941(-)